MFTLFHMLKLMGAVAGAALGAVYGYQALGWPGAAGGVPGFLIGAFIGNLPWVVCGAWLRYRLKRSSVAELKEWLQRKYFISHLIIAELVVRDEPLEQFRGHVAGLLRSLNAAERSFGEGTARIWFPDLLGDGSPAGSSSTPAARVNDE